MKVNIINGPMGVGKTTIGKYISENNARTAFIDGDWCLDLHPFVENTLVCDKDELIRRWKNDDKCEWRTDHWLEISLKSLPQFLALDNCFDTSGLTIPQIAEAISK